ncbi:MAG TPA: helix-turn-helix domain-containing protein, partial [Casimicrobiaceae bacterium]
MTLDHRDPPPHAPAQRRARREAVAPNAKERRGIQSVETGGELLRSLTRHASSMMLKDLARDAGMAPAKAHPYLVSFAKL